MISQRLLDAFAELRKEKVSDHRGARALSADVFGRIAELCDTYLTQDAEREGMRALVSFEISFLFFSFSYETAEMAVRRHSEKLITESITALLIENAVFDYRDSIIALFGGV